MANADVTFEAIGDVHTGWGESLVWDDRRQRLYWVDCAASTLHWIGHESTDVGELRLPSMGTGVVPTEDDRLVVVVADSLHLVDPDRATTERIAPNPPGMDGRCNDACADLDGNLITGKLNAGPEPGATWRYSSDGTWTELDDDISNTNGPQVFRTPSGDTLIVGDTATHYYAYDYDPATGAATDRRIYGDLSDLDGLADGSALDAYDGLWCALVRGGQLARFTGDGLDRTIAVPCRNPTDIAFGGPHLDQLFVVSIGGKGALDGTLLVGSGLGVRGRPEPRFRL